MSVPLSPTEGMTKHIQLQLQYFAEPGKMETLPYVTTFATIKDEPDLDDIQNTPSRNPGGDGV